MNVYWSCSAVFFLCILQALETRALTLNAYQSSTADQWKANYGADGNPNTCSMTGYGRDNWWMVDLGSVKDIQSVSLNGSSSAVNVRIGLKVNEVTDRRGFDENPLCATIADGLKYDMINYMCNRRVTGRYLSLQSVDPSVINQLSVCDFEVFLAE